MNIGIDVDGVLADIHAATLPLVKKYTGTHIEKPDISHWYYVSEEAGIPNWTFIRIMAEAWQDFKNVPLEETGISDSLSQLMRRGHHVTIVTQRTRETFANVCLWLDMHRIPYDDLVFSSGTLDKLTFPIDVLVDDSPRIMHTARHSPEKKLFLRDQPWNRDVTDVPPNAERVSNLAEAVERISNMPMQGSRRRRHGHW